MDKIEVVIKIPKEDYMFIKTMVENGYETPSSYYYNIASGIVLPKGHGRLFILDEELTKKFFTSFSFSCQKWISEVGISNATLKVIESDKEIENE